MRFTAGEIAAHTNGSLADSTPTDLVVDGASIDSRDITAGQLFVPIIAERDGHDFIAAARERGAAMTLTSQGSVTDGPAVRVDSTDDALSDLGRAAAARLHGSGVPIVGITGSVGKTSVKDLAAAAMSSLHAHASRASFNNELGVPLTLLNASDDAGVAVVEMGARGMGHIAHLCDIAQPTVGLVTMVAEVHTSEFGTIEAVAQAKGELLASLPPTGTAIVNHDSAFADDLAARSAAPVVRYSTSAADGVAVWATDVELDDELRPTFVAHTSADAATVRLPVSGLHQVSNALAAVAIAQAAGVDLAAAVAGIADSALSRWRMEMHRTPAGALVINDAYNANLTSMTAAIESLAAVDAQRRVAVVGTMAELGDLHDAHHAAVSTLAADHGIELIAFGEAAYGVDQVSSIDEALKALGGLGAGDAVLVKGSRVAGLERVASALLAAQ